MRQDSGFFSTQINSLDSCGQFITGDIEMRNTLEYGYTDLSQEEIAALEAEQEAAPHLRPLQKRLAKEVTRQPSCSYKYK